MSGVADYYGKVEGAESPTGVDNTAGSGAYSRFQFMPDTANAYAGKLPWGQGLAPDAIKAAITSDPAKARQVAELYTADSDTALRGSGLPVTDSNRFALHRFGPAGGVSLLNAKADTPVADWVRSVQWGNGISPDAVIKQNGLDKFVNVGDLRSRFIGQPMHGSASNPTPAHVAGVEAMVPATPIAPAAGPAMAQGGALDLSSLFGTPDSAPLFGGAGNGWTPARRRRA